GGDQFYSTYYFQYDLTQPAPIVDLSACFENQKKFVYLYISGLTMERVEKDETLLLRRAVKTLSKELGIPFTRIAQPQIAFKGDKGYLVFYLLGLPKRSMDVISPYSNQPSLAQALATLKKKTESKSLSFEIGNNNKFVKGLASIEEQVFESPKGADQGYSAGALAGLCAGMAVLGLAAGGGGGYWFFIRRQ
ncbi:hypothetical protein ElyMa_004115700, partial [Elysia marginata]